ncbi:hypothetical protein ACQYAC_12710 [Bacillus sp. MM09(2025)]|uniref:hypothetical protein n=1 Tax=Bacillus sp. MM09(2025) TaxID=3422493 RepID=UPI003D2B5947
MSYFVFKLNIQPNILLKYKDNNEIEYLLSRVIPLGFESVLQIKENKNLFELIPEKNDEQDFQNSFEDLEINTIKLFKLYNKVLSHYKEKHEIHYSQDFLNLNEICMSARRTLENKYPGIIKAYEVIEDEKIDQFENIETNSKVGTGITHLRKFYKIKFYLENYKENNVINTLNLRSFYNPRTEHILVESSSEIAALNYISDLVKLVNSNSSANKHLGKININPIYDSISLEGEYSEISYVIVYPNGNPPLDRHNILQEAEAKEVETKLLGADGKPLNNPPIQQLLENEARQGYLKSVISKGRNIFKRIKTLTRIDETS